MKRYEIVYSDDYRPSPVSFWVHQHLDAEAWLNAEDFDPPLPRPVPGCGWASLLVDVDGVRLVFSSTEEVEHVIDVLSQNPLPTTRQLSIQRGTTVGPNRHWLSRLPAKAKPAKFRDKLVRYLKRCLPEFRAASTDDRAFRY